MNVQQLFRVVSVCVAVALLPGCALLGAGKSKPAPIAENSSVDNQVGEAKLRSMVEKRLSASQQHNSPNAAQLNFRKPYFYKEYVEYPDGIQAYTLGIRESDSKGTPYSARVILPKKRFVTALEKKKSKARSDESFSEATGIETLSYEFRHGHWRETGSVFIADENGSVAVSASVAEETSESAKTESDESSSGVMNKILFWRK